MIDRLRLNTKLYGFDGVIGRHDYFLNTIIIFSISLLFTLPFYLWTLFYSKTVGDLLKTSKMFEHAPFYVGVLFFIGASAAAILTISNVFRRLNDINGKVNLFSNIIFSVMFFIYAY